MLLCTWASVIVLEWAVGGHAFNWTRVGLAKDNKTRKIFRVDINGGGEPFFFFFFPSSSYLNSRQIGGWTAMEGGG